MFGTYHCSIEQRESGELDLNTVYFNNEKLVHPNMQCSWGYCGGGPNAMAELLLNHFIANNRFDTNLKYELIRQYGELSAHDFCQDVIKIQSEDNDFNITTGDIYNWIDSKINITISKSIKRDTSIDVLVTNKDMGLIYKVKVDPYVNDGCTYITVPLGLGYDNFHYDTDNNLDPRITDTDGLCEYKLVKGKVTKWVLVDNGIDLKRLGYKIII